MVIAGVLLGRVEAPGCPAIFAAWAPAQLEAAAAYAAAAERTTNAAEVAFLRARRATLRT